MLVSDRFEERLTAVEEGLKMQSGLRAAVDKDLSKVTEELRGMKRVLQAVGTTQSEHTVLLARLAETLRVHSTALDSLDGRLGTIETHISSLDRRMSGSDARMIHVTDRLFSSDTRMAEIEGRVVGMDGKLDRLIAVLERPSQTDDSKPAGGGRPARRG
jgi:chromosome segregation ATPase